MIRFLQKQKIKNKKKNSAFPSIKDLIHVENKKKIKYIQFMNVGVVSHSIQSYFPHSTEKK